MPTPSSPTPAAPAKAAAAPVKPFETPATQVQVERMADDAPASAVLNLDKDAFAKALGLPAELAPAVEEPAAAEAEEAEAAPAAAATPAVSPAAAAVEEAAAEEEAPAEPVVETPKRTLETQFAVHDHEGELEVPDILLTFKANGKDYEKLPLDKVVRFAQMGIYNAEKEQKYAQMGSENNTLKAERDSFQTQAKEYESYYERLLADPSFYERAAMLYSEQNTPEQRLARDRQKLHQEREQFQQHREAQQVSSFVSAELIPTMEKLLQQNPLVSEREALGQYTLLTAPLLDRGRVPLSRLPEVKSLVQHDLTAWIEATQLDRAGTKATQEKAVQAAQRKAALAKRVVARAAAPQGKAGSVAPPKSKNYESVDSWLKEGGGVLPPLPTEE